MSPTRSTDTNLVWFSKNISFPCSKHCKGAEPPSPNLVVAPLHFQCQVKLLKEKKVTWQIVHSELTCFRALFGWHGWAQAQQKDGDGDQELHDGGLLGPCGLFSHLPAASSLLFTETKSITISRHKTRHLYRLFPCLATLPTVYAASLSKNKPCNRSTEL